MDDKADFGTVVLQANGEVDGVAGEVNGLVSVKEGRAAGRCQRVHGADRNAEPCRLWKAVRVPFAFPLGNLGRKLLLKVAERRDHGCTELICEMLAFVCMPEQESAVSSVFREIRARDLDQAGGVFEEVAPPVLKGIIE